jgi:Cu/Ag efflux pump CusA
MIATVPVFQRLGSEFMPPLDEGSLLVMPTTFAGIAIEEARRAMTAQDRIIMRFGEVASVHGKVGRADTAIAENTSSALPASTLRYSIRSRRSSGRASRLHCCR